MTIEALRELFHRDLVKLKSEIKLYDDESRIWHTENSIENSAGNLCLHIIGNLKTYIGNGLSQSGYVRNREFEFLGKDVKRQELLVQIDETIKIVDDGLSNISDKDLDVMFPIVIWQKKTGMAYTLIHLHSHLNYHLGQINYHRRIIGLK